MADRITAPKLTRGRWAGGAGETARPVSDRDRSGHGYRGALWGVAGLTLAAAALRFGTLDLQSFHHDEAVTAGRVLQPGLHEMLEMVRESERNGPLYYLLAWLWSKAFGTGEAGLRSLSALFGTVTVPVAYLAATRVAPRRAAAIAAALVAVNPYLFWYSQEARPYGLLVLLSALALLFFLEAETSVRRSSLIGWALAAAGALATHYFALFLVVPQALWLLHTRRGGAWPAVLGVGAAGLALLPLAAEQSGTGTRNLFAEASLSDRMLDLAAKTVGGEEITACSELVGLGCDGAKLGALGVALGAAGLALLAARSAGSERHGGFLAAAVGAAGVALPLLLAVGGLDLFNPRNTVGALPPLLVAAAIGYGARRSGPVGAVLAVGLVATFVAGVVAILAREELQRPDWRGVAEEIGEPSRPRLIIGPLKGDDPLELYLGGARKLRGTVSDIGQDRLQGGPIAVRELLVVTELAETPRPNGFTLTGSGTAGGYRVLRHEAARPRTVDPSEIEGERLVGTRFVVLLQRRPG